MQAHRPRRCRRLMLMFFIGFLSFDCAGGENFNEFRETAGPGLESGLLAVLSGDEAGVSTMVDGIVQGLFAVFDPDCPSSSCE